MFSFSPKAFGLQGKPHKFSLFGPADYPTPEPVRRPPDGVVQWFSVAGWDIGKIKDPSALCVIARAIYGRWYEGPRDERWWLVKCENLPRGMAYPDQVEYVLGQPVDFLCFDATGGGGVIKDYVRRDVSRYGFQGRTIPVVIAASNMHEAVHKEGGLWSVPKRELVQAMNICLQLKKVWPLPKVTDEQGRVVDPGTTEEYKALMDQAQSFELTRTKEGSLKMEGKGHGVDDLCIAFMLSAWWITKHGVRREPAILM